MNIPLALSYLETATELADNMHVRHAPDCPDCGTCDCGVERHNQRVLLLQVALANALQNLDGRYNAKT